MKRPTIRSHAAQVSRLEAAKRLYGAHCAAKVEKLLRSLSHSRSRDAESLIRIHDALLFLRAFPQSRGVVQKTEQLLAKLGAEVDRLGESGVDISRFDGEECSGIANTAIRHNFTYDVAHWLAQRYPQQVSAEWDWEEQSRPMAITLPRFLPLLEDDSWVEADTPYLEWISNAAGGGRELQWLLQCFEDTPVPISQKTELYDALAIQIRWQLGDSPASRTRARRAVPEFFFHKSPLIRRDQVSLAQEIESAPLPLRKMVRPEAEEVLDMCRDAVTVRYRELYGTTRGDADQVYEANVGRGVQIFLWGLPPDRRLPLRAYHAGFTLKNGVPINYIEGISLFEWMEVGFNTFYAYRDGETAWIYSKVVHLFHQLAGVTCISVYPYQLGHQNEEAIQSGAFWFYRKLGFRPGRPELLSLAQREERKMARDPRHRTSAHALRKLAAGHVFYEFGQTAHGRWDTFSTRNIGFTVQRSMAQQFHGNAGNMRRAATEMLAQVLEVDFESWSPLEQPAFENFALVLSLAPEIEQWTGAQKRSLVQIVRAKAGPEETEYLRLLQQHDGLREVFLRLGSKSSRPPRVSRK